jgi:hypothetical protein
MEGVLLDLDLTTALLQKNTIKIEVTYHQEF